MFPVYLYGPIALLAVVVLVFAVPILYARGRWLKCRNCGEVFRAPAMDVRTHGVGLSPPYLGRVACPKCGQAERRGRYTKVPAPGASAG